MSAHLKYGTIHPRTMARDLDSPDSGPAAYLRELAFRDFYAAVLHQWPRSAWHNWNPNFDAIETDTDASAKAAFEALGKRVLGSPRIGAHGTLICFLHPKDMGGVLTEIMETPKEAH